MRLVEDAADRNRLFKRLGKDRFIVRAKQYGPVVQGGWPRKHSLWPCVRLGAGAAFLDAQGRDWHPKTSVRGRSLNFLRGHSHEALIAEGQSITFVYEGVANEIDEWTGEPMAPFTEIKSTMLSSTHMWPLVQKGQLDILHPFENQKFMSYFEQCCQNCVATGTDTCRLRIFFMNGEYGLRRKNCPECKGTLGEQQDVFKQCEKCGYKAYSVDLRSYILMFNRKELAHFRREVFGKRRDQYRLAVKSESVKQVLMRAEPTKCFLCARCAVGKELGCELVGGS